MKFNLISDVSCELTEYQSVKSSLSSEENIELDSSTMSSTSINAGGVSPLPSLAIRCDSMTSMVVCVTWSVLGWLNVLVDSLSRSTSEYDGWAVEGFSINAGGGRGRGRRLAELAWASILSSTESILSSIEWIWITMCDATGSEMDCSIAFSDRLERQRLLCYDGWMAEFQARLRNKLMHSANILLSRSRIEIC